MAWPVRLASNGVLPPTCAAAHANIVFSFANLKYVGFDVLT